MGGFKLSVAGDAAVAAEKLKIGERVRIVLGNRMCVVEPHPAGTFEVMDVACVHDLRMGGALTEVELRVRRAAREA